MMTDEEIINLTDEQIDVMVTKCFYNVHDHEYAEKGRQVILKRGDAICDGGVTVCGGALYKFDRLGLSFYSVKDYCNDPSVMWSLIATMVQDDHIVQILKAGVIVTLAGGGIFEHIDANPLRAAAIVYLKIKGVL